MIPSTYAIVGLLACLAALAAVIMTPYLRAFKHAWFLIASVIAVLYAGTKPDPPPTPPTPPASGVTIRVLGTTVSNVTLTVTATTNEFGLTSSWEARRMVTLENVSTWGIWETVGEQSIILSTDYTVTVDGKFVNERRDTQLRLRYGDGNLSNGVTP